MLCKYIDIKLHGWTRVATEQVASAGEEEGSLQLIQKYIVVLKVLFENLLLSNRSLWNQWQQTVLIDPINKLFQKLTTCASDVPNASLYVYKHDVEHVACWISRVFLKLFGCGENLLYILQQLPSLTQYLPAEYVLKLVSMHK
jgi:hypothetical protein